MDGPAKSGEHLPKRVHTILHPLVHTFSQNQNNIVENVPVCDIVFCFDTTGSMSSVLSSLREHLSETVERLFRDIPNLRIGIIGHGDYCDVGGGKYLAYYCPLSTNKEDITKAIKEIPSTGGGDAPEAYEYMLHLAHTKIEWKSNVKLFVLIADEVPHEEGYHLPLNCLHHPELGRGNKCETLRINWRQEVEMCRQKGIILFSCHALANSNRHAVPFYTEMADKTNGYYFVLDDLQSFYFYMNTICFKAADAAEDLQIMKEKKEKLVHELRDVQERVREMESRGETGEHVEALRTTSSNLTSAFCDLTTIETEINSIGLFRSPAIKLYSNRVREEEGVDSDEEHLSNEELARIGKNKSIRKAKRANRYVSETEEKKKNLSSASIDFLNLMKEE